jgi:hypothetical protein
MMRLSKPGAMRLGFQVVKKHNLQIDNAPSS